MKLGEMFRKQVFQALESYELPVSDAALNLLVMIAAHESGGFRYLQQINGPALGVFQMEPFTYHDLCSYIQSRKQRFPVLSRVSSSVMAQRMVIDNTFAAAMARTFLMRIPEALPAADNIEALARYAKQHWNTNLGKATWEDYFNAYQEYCQ